jgi:hypothetical protein
MKLKLPKLKNIKLYYWLKFLPLGTMILLLILLSTCLLFLNKYFYQTITEIKVVSLLQNQISLSKIDLPLYQQVFDKWESKKKSNIEMLENLNDPFRPISSTPLNPSALESANKKPNQPQKSPSLSQ